MESSTCLPPTMLSWIGGTLFGACAALLCPFCLVGASELLWAPRCNHQSCLTIASDSGITRFRWGMWEDREESMKSSGVSTGQPKQGCRELHGGSRR